MEVVWPTTNTGTLARPGPIWALDLLTAQLPIGNTLCKEKSRVACQSGPIWAEGPKGPYKRFLGPAQICHTANNPL